MPRERGGVAFFSYQIEHGTVSRPADAKRRPFPGMADHQPQQNKSGIKIAQPVTDIDHSTKRGSNETSQRPSIINYKYSRGAVVILAYLKLSTEESCQACRSEVCHKQPLNAIAASRKAFSRTRTPENGRVGHPAQHQCLTGMPTSQALYAAR